MKEIISGAQAHYKIQDINFVKVPYFPELAPKKIAKLLPEDLKNKMGKYIPEILSDKEPHDREYFFNILNTLNSHLVKKLVYN